MLGQQVSMDCLPSKGRTYPTDIEIWVAPLNVGDQIEMDRYGVTQAEYYSKVLEGITIKGNPDFDKNNLFFHDVQLLDLVRRIYTDEPGEKVVTDKYPCMYDDCIGTIDYEFTLDQLTFTDFKENIFGKTFTFSDGLNVTVSPVRVGKYIALCRQYFSNKQGSASDMYFAYLAATVEEIFDVDEEGKKLPRGFDEKTNAQEKFLMDYFGKLYKRADKKVLLDIEQDTVSVVEPFEVVCPKCGRMTEVIITPTTTFQ